LIRGVALAVLVGDAGQGVGEIGASSVLGFVVVVCLAAAIGILDGGEVALGVVGVGDDAAGGVGDGGDTLLGIVAEVQGTAGVVGDGVEGVGVAVASTGSRKVVGERLGAAGAVGDSEEFTSSRVSLDGVVSGDSVAPADAVSRYISV